MHRLTTLGKRRPDGSRVAGQAMSMDDPSSMADLIRALGGDFITPDHRFVADQPPAIAAITPMRDCHRRQRLFAAATLQRAPVLAFILSAQRCVIAGLTAGAVKG
jgi:hypothetical protein